MKKILTVFGTRPEAIKMAPLVSALNSDNFFNSKVCVTAQHREMLDQVLDLFEIKPDFDLDLMSKNQDLYDITSQVLLGVREVLNELDPDIVLVHGDTATTFAAALAAFYKKIPVGHVEAGLRTNNILSPWPEEANRVLTSKIAQYHFAPTERNKNALLNEHIKDNKIIITGNTVIDALHITVDKIESKNILRKKISDDFNRIIPNFSSKKYVLVTGHRRENFGSGLENICSALKTLSTNNPNFNFVYPVHLNPNVQEPVKRLLGDKQNIMLIKPLSYEHFVFLMKNCFLVLTDSGGIQEEAPSLGKPVLVMRESTERPEAIDAGTVKLVGTDANKIIYSVQELIDNNDIYKKMSQSNNPYGDGKASDRIINYLKTIQ